MGIYMIDCFTGDAGIFQGIYHSQCSAFTFRMRCGHVISVTRQASSDKFCVDLRAPGLCMLQLFEDERSGPFRKNKAFAVDAERTGSLRRISGPG